METLGTEKVYKTPIYIRKAVNNYYQKNKEMIREKVKVNEKSKQYYRDVIKNDPEKLEKKRQRDREYRLRKKEELIKLKELFLQNIKSSI